MGGIVLVGREAAKSPAVISVHSLANVHRSIICRENGVVPKLTDVFLHPASDESCFCHGPIAALPSPQLSRGKIMKSSFIAVVAAFSLGWMPEALRAAESPRAENSTLSKRPNVLFILVDDYGIKDVGVEGSAFYETPHIDALTSGGMRFTQGYAACQVCSPSRASILLGKYPPRHGITDYIGAAVGEAFAKQRQVQLLVPDYARSLPAADTTLAEALKQSGYHTFFAGKWHLGSKGSWPEDHGFDINKGGWDVGSPIGGYYAPW
jgi:hypothetical protein